MPYVIGFSPRGQKDAKIDTGEVPTARDALKQVQGLRLSDEAIRFIKDARRSGDQ